MQREQMLRRLQAHDDPWDLLLIGGGATGLGTAVEAASRGYRTLLLEQHDFCKGTSSRSTKLVHGGVRYLQQGNLTLVLEALRERGRLLRNAPHLVKNLPLVVPLYDWWEGPFYGIGLRLYDALAGKLGFGASKNLSREETLQRLPTIEPEGLRGGVIYYDGQFDDARLALALARTAADLDAVLLNYVRVTGLRRNGDGMVTGVTAEDQLSGERYDLSARAVVNATGIFTDEIRRMDDQDAAPMMQVSSGVHLVLDADFLPGDTAILVPETDDGRVLFAIPWHGRIVLGTTDVPREAPELEPRALDEEVAYLLEHAARYLTRDPAPDDVLSVFTGLRPLVRRGDTSDTAAISRDHTLHIARSGLVTIAGGKWTTYRKMAEDTVDQAAVVAGLPERPCVTRELHLHGWDDDQDPLDGLGVYGSDADAVQAVLDEQPGWDAPLHPRLPYLCGEVVWAARHEMAQTVEDVLSRRTRALLLDARASVEAAPEVARLLAAVHGHDEAWQHAQVAAYEDLAGGYLLAAAGSE